MSPGRSIMASREDINGFLAGTEHLEKDVKTKPNRQNQTFRNGKAEKDKVQRAKPNPEKSTKVNPVNPEAKSQGIISLGTKLVSLKLIFIKEIRGIEGQGI
ncbi:hypothetical protein Tco_1345552 [Tanacetum coccineum]